MGDGGGGQGPGTAKGQFETNRDTAQRCLKKERSALSEALQREITNPIFDKALDAAEHATSIPRDQWNSFVDRQDMSDAEKRATKQSDGFTTPSGHIYIRGGDVSTPQMVFHEAIHALIGYMGTGRPSVPREESFIIDFIHQHPCTFSS